MKKLIIILCLAMFAVTGYSQATAASAMTVTDTVVDTGTETATLKSVGAYSNVAIQAVVTKISGTVAGTAILKGSLDGVNYVNISTDTLTLTNVTTNTYIWNIAPTKYLY